MVEAFRTNGRITSHISTEFCTKAHERKLTLP
jgi:hypothetical protein